MAGGLQFQDNPGRGFVTDITLAQYRLVAFDSAGLDYCVLDANNDWIGVTMEPRTFVAGTTPVVPVRFRHAGTIPCTASATEAIAIGDVVYKAASGKVGKTSTGSLAVGIAMSTAAVDGDWLEVMPY